MSKYIFKILILLFFLSNNTIAKENIMILKLKDGDVKIELFNNVAPKCSYVLKSEIGHI